MTLRDSNYDEVVLVELAGVDSVQDGQELAAAA